MAETIENRHEIREIVFELSHGAFRNGCFYSVIRSGPWHAASGKRATHPSSGTGIGQSKETADVHVKEGEVNLIAEFIRIGVDGTRYSDWQDALTPAFWLRHSN